MQKELKQAHSMMKHFEATMKKSEEKAKEVKKQQKVRKPKEAGESDQREGEGS